MRLIIPSLIVPSLALGLAAALAPAAAQTVSPTPAAACAREGRTGISELHREWILVGWEKKSPDEPWEFETKLGRYYDWASKDVMFYDDFDPQYRVARSPAEYSAIFTAPFKSLRSARHLVIDGPDAIVVDGLATSTLEFAARLEAADGAITAIRTRSTLIWRCTSDGWRIAREHNSSRRIAAEEAARLFERSER